MKIQTLRHIFFLVFFSCCTYVQAQKIIGTVSDGNGPLPGASVLVKGTSNGTTTDFDGKFSLDNLSANAVLQISYMGYNSQEIAINNQTSINIVLVEDASQLEEVVVVGYGTQKKSLVTGAISSIKSSDIQNNASTRVEQAIQGKVSGISVLSNSGSPGAASKIRIRGTGSNGNSDPIYIVDGMKTSSIDNIDGGDIQSIEVLKDAASSAIYGTEGANGVVLITTKSGKNYDKPVISYNSQFGFQSERTQMTLMNETQYRTYLNEAGVQNISSNGINTNWLNEVFENAWVEKHHLSFAGGSEKSTYLLSGSYTNQDGIVGGDRANFKRYTARLNSKHKMNDWLEVGNNLSYSNTSRGVIVEDDEYRSILNNALLMDPLTPVTYNDGVPSNVANLANSGLTILSDKNGDYYGLPAYVTGEIANPLAMLTIQNKNIKTDKILGTFFANLTPIEGLVITSRLGIDVNYAVEHNWDPVYYVSSERQNSIATVDDNITKTSSWLWENFATYTNTYKKHDYTILLGTTAEKYQSPDFYLFSGPMPKAGDNYAYHDYSQDDDLDKTGGSYVEKRKRSVFGRFSYSYDEKYLLEGTLRYDESSAFSEANKGAYFPSLSAGWVMSNESFWKEDSKINYLKMRASWGQVGSDQNLYGNEDLQFYTSEGVKIPDGNGGFLPGYEADDLPNADLTWETSEQLDLGMDLRAFDGKLSFTTDYYHKKTKDLIVSGNGLIPLSVGRNFGSFNGGTVSNKGWEFELGYHNTFGDFSYGVNVNLSTLKNEVTQLAVDSPIDGVNVRGFDTTRFEEGQPIWYYRGYKTNGIDDTTGEPIIVDVDGSGDITANDITNIGDPHPDLLYGGQINLGYKNWDFNINFQGVQGNEIYMLWNRTDRPYSNKPAFLFDGRWTGGGSKASYPKADVSSDYLYRSDLMVGDGSYMRIKQIQLGYSLPSQLLEKLKIDRLRLSLSVENYFTITNYQGLDPEAGSTDNLSQGIDRGVYPIPGKIIFGLSVNL
ncbi:SusC/RagA family TonB-linked outer membrane protein [Algibacter pacificus]|uniref:SusC/RagA family TonB-linked outer membrane protein n=1 Tax=Algibacter pacificus TaxID=2599389 RepID=UPI0011CC3FA5|nr:TonB-dependent receptor [Algibacter pacificus]